jgi:hypothetical protein
MMVTGQVSMMMMMIIVRRGNQMTGVSDSTRSQVNQSAGRFGLESEYSKEGCWQG